MLRGFTSKIFEYVTSSIMSQNQSKWRKLEAFNFSRFTNPVFINDEEFIVCPSKYQKYKGDGIWKYNIKQHQWRKVIDYDEDTEIYAQSTAFDSNNDCLYIFRTQNGNQMKLDLNTKQLDIVKTAIPTQRGNGQTFESGLKLLHIDDKLHGIGGPNRPNPAIHCSWSISRGNLIDKTMHKLSKSINRPCYRHGLIYLKTQKCMLLFGGKSAKNKTKNSIYKYSIVDQKWTELDIKMPIAISSFGIVKTRNERYIILFGGSIGTGYGLNQIYIFDTRIKIWRKSNVMTPTKAGFVATISNSNSLQDEKLCFGYIRNCYNENDFVHLKLLPYYLMKFISRWVSNETVYLMRRKSGRYKHVSAGMWSIGIDDIL